MTWRLVLLGPSIDGFHQVLAAENWTLGSKPSCLHGQGNVANAAKHSVVVPRISLMFTMSSKKGLSQINERSSFAKLFI